ncbi:MAG TPA: class I SAM-dependent methyltransferase [Opitutaceae bacterium]|nr:class I SAM-dependent methyltransferase [Opitutaceae bacterium]
MDADEYVKMAGVEDRMWYFRSLHRHVARALAAEGLPADAAVLDAGCGTGGVLLRAREWPTRARWSAIDFMPLACELARKRCGPEVDIRQASITSLPFGDASFDAVVSADVICQVENPEVAMAEFFRVLRPGGILVINVPAYMWMWSYHDDTVQTKHRYTRPEIAALLRGAGFTARQLTHWNALPFPAVWAKRKIFRSAGDTSDVKEYPRAVDAVFAGMMAIEHAWLKAGGRWAWGTSVFAVARKPAGISRGTAPGASETSRTLSRSG